VLALDPAPVVPRVYRANRVLDWRKDRIFFWQGFGGKNRILLLGTGALIDFVNSV